MKIVIITTEAIFPHKIRGGHELRVYELTKRIASKHEVHVVQYAGDNKVWSLENTILHDIPAMPGFFGRFIYDRFWHLGRYIFMIRVSSQVRQINPDLADYNSWVFPVGRRRYRMIGTCFIMSVSSNVDRRIAKIVRRFDAFLTRYKVKKADYAIHLSKQTRSVFLDYEKAIARKSSYVPNGVDSDLFKKRDKDACRSSRNLPSSNNLILYVSRLVPYKRPIDFLVALKELPNDYFGVIVGDGPMLQEIRNWINLNGMSHRVLIKGFVSNRLELAEIYSSCDVAVYPTEFETQPIMPQEAMACGIPVIATNVVGNNEIIANDWNGVLVELGDTASLRKQIVRVIEDASFRENLIRNGLEYMKSRSWDTTALNTLSIYEDILRANR